ncbi:hypothetical protein FRX31_002876, partial [Thalictrum thalictroides]
CNSWRSSLPPFPKSPLLLLSEPSQEKEKSSNVNPNPPPLRGFVGIGGGEQ